MNLDKNAYPLAFAIGVVTGLVIVWMNVAAGLIGIEDDDPTNLLYVAVLGVGFVGAIVARFQPRGLARAAFATALAQAIVGVIAVRLPNTAGVVAIVLLHSAFVAAFITSGLLFRHAARPHPPAGAARRPCDDEIPLPNR
jgi:hypothetical protein